MAKPSPQSTRRTLRGALDPRVAERRRSIAIRVGATAVVVLVAVAVGVWVIVSNNSDSTQSAASAPSVATTDGAFRVGARDPQVVVSVFEDFQCPVCKQFESVFGDVLQQLSTNPAVAIDYHPVALLDRMSSTEYSTRAANASACVAQQSGAGGDLGPWRTFHTALYAQQPPEGGAGLPDSTLISIAEQSGTGGIDACVEEGTYKRWVAAVSQNAIDGGVQGTPTVRINNTDAKLSTPDQLRGDVEAALR